MDDPTSTSDKHLVSQDVGSDNLAGAEVLPNSSVGLKYMMWTRDVMVPKY